MTKEEEEEEMVLMGVMHRIESDDIFSSSLKFLISFFFRLKKKLFFPSLAQNKE